MTGKIHLRQPDGALRAMSEAGFAREGTLQQLPEDYPDLLGGEQLDSAEPRRIARPSITFFWTGKACRRSSR